MSVVLKKTGEQPKPDTKKIFKKRFKSQFESGHEQSAHEKDVGFFWAVNIEKRKIYKDI